MGQLVKLHPSSMKKVQLHPSILLKQGIKGNLHPLIETTNSLSDILHPSIEIPNNVPVLYLKFSIDAILDQVQN